MWHRNELTYCSNVHPGTTLCDVRRNIRGPVSSVADKRHLNNMGAGLWLSNQTCEQLYQDECERNHFFALLEQEHLYLATLNGFPFGDFHSDVVKQSVYTPTWAERARYDYTLKLAQICSVAPRKGLPDGEISISTLPLGYAASWNETLHQQACRQLCLLAEQLRLIKKSTGCHIRVCLEMEPDCVLEKSAQLVHFFSHDLLAVAHELGMPESTVFDFLGCCFDVCHQAVMHEDCFESMGAITRAGVVIAKIQVSNAPSAWVSSCEDAYTLCSLFSEPKFLHQVKIKQNNGQLIHIPDLTVSSLDTLFESCVNEDKGRLYPGAWHLHFHVPIHMAEIEFPSISTTQSSISEVLRYLSECSSDLVVKPCLEVETYTWPQFSKNETFDLSDGIVDELNWLETQLTTLGLFLD